MGNAAATVAEAPTSTATAAASGSSSLPQLEALVESSFFSRVVSVAVAELEDIYCQQHPAQAGFYQVVATASGLDVRLQPGLRLVTAAVLCAATVLLCEGDAGVELLGTTAVGEGGVGFGGEIGPGEKRALEEGLVGEWSNRVVDFLEEAGIAAAAVGDGDEGGGGDRKLKLGTTSWLAAVQSYCLARERSPQQQQQQQGRDEDRKQHQDGCQQVQRQEEQQHQVTLEVVILPLRELIVARLQELQAQLRETQGDNGNKGADGEQEPVAGRASSAAVEGELRAAEHLGMIQEYKSQKLNLLLYVIRGLQQ
jgi:hypothetical protein